MDKIIYKSNPQSVEDRKLLGTVHAMGTINEYYQVRVNKDGQYEFIFLMVRHTKNSVSEYLIEENDLPNDISVL